MENDKQKGFFDGPPQTMFAFGIATGVAICAILAFGLGGFNTGIANVDNGEVVADGGAAEAAAPSQAPATIKLAVAVNENDHIVGDLSKAKVVLVEYSDFQCPYCSRHHPTMSKLVDDYGDDVAWVYRHFPLGGHAEAVPAAIASECADKQGEFRGYADRLFEERDDLGQDLYIELAKEFDLNIGDFEECLTDESVINLVKEDYDSGIASGVSGTPATFVNDKFISGALPYSEFKKEIDKMLAQ